MANLSAPLSRRAAEGHRGDDLGHREQDAPPAHGEAARGARPGTASWPTPPPSCSGWTARPARPARADAPHRDPERARSPSGRRGTWPGCCCARSPGTEVTLVELSTEGDRMLDSPLSRIGGKGLFVKEIEAALLDGRADLAVHSLKDVTSTFPPGLVLAAVPEREDPRDAWVSPGGLRFADIPPARPGRDLVAPPGLPAPGAAPRRGGGPAPRQRGDAAAEDRGARASPAPSSPSPASGASSWKQRVTELLPPEVMLPAVGQGALALECTVDSLHPAAARIARASPHAECPSTPSGPSSSGSRAGAPCRSPRTPSSRGTRSGCGGLVGAPDGSEVVRAERRGPASAARAMGRDLAEELLRRGARALLDAHAGARSGV